MAFEDNLSDGLSGGAQGAAAGSVFGLPGAMVGGGVGAIGGILAGNAQRKKANQEAARINAEQEARILQQLKALEGYDPKAYHRDEQYAGDIYAPDLPSSRNLTSEMGGIRLDPNLIANQSASLSGLSDIIGQGGMTLQDKANFQDANDAAQRQASRQQALLQDNMAARGLAGSGNETVSRMMAAQGAADASAKSARDMNAMAQKRALEAIMSRGTLAGSMAGQDFDRQSKVASAKDIINSFNERNRLNQGNMAADNQLQVDRANRDAKQGVERNNVQGLSNLGTAVGNKATNVSNVYGNKPLSVTPNVPNPMQTFQQGISSVGAGIKGYQDYQTGQKNQARLDKHDQWDEEDRNKRIFNNTYDMNTPTGRIS